MENVDKIEAICALIGAVAVILGGVWFIIERAFKSGKNAHRLEEIEKNTSNLPCVLHGDDLLKIKTILIQKYPSSVNIFSMKASPRILNKLGIRLFNDIDGNSFLEENKDVLFKFITESNPLAELDVEQAANTACLSLISTPAFTRMKDFVYNSPSIEIEDGKKYDISLNDICFVLSIPLRDMYLNDVGLKDKS
ncbi:MAG: hypothetical protein LBL90_12625 [Prevotellaceae bacterium]|jgi:hypothetical protein|nr:hypothetical protein [Prevotellaceae bacterium]